MFRCFLVSDTQVAKVGILGRVDMRQPAFVRLCAALHSISCILGVEHLEPGERLVQCFRFKPWCGSGLVSCLSSLKERHEVWWWASFGLSPSMSNETSSGSKLAYVASSNS